MKVFYQHAKSSDSAQWSFLGDKSGLCIGYVWYDAQREHVYELEGFNLKSEARQSNYAGPLNNFHAGGKKPKAKCTAKSTSSQIVKRVQKPSSVINTEREFLPPPFVISEGDLSRVNLPVDLTHCRARVWNSGLDYGAQCLATPHPNT